VIDGKLLIAWGHTPGAYFKDAIRVANETLAATNSYADARAAAEKLIPAPITAQPLNNPADIPFYANIEAVGEGELANVLSVKETMNELIKTPTIEKAAIMPDACPAGPLGTIPVGGVVACDNAIHPGFHSADICCSMAASFFGYADPKAVLDAAHGVTHFGGGGRKLGNIVMPDKALLGQFADNTLLNGLTMVAMEHHATQGDGNHFLYVGRLKSTGETVMVTHHGSRKPGALLYKAGMKLAEAYTSKHCPEALKGNAWIPADSSEGETYWEALQIIRAWTKSNHYAIHDLTAAKLNIKPTDRFWNEHNFVFRRSDGLFYHGKGATPAFQGWADDASGYTLIPLNMAQPILIARGKDADNGLGFAPHGAGRNWGRKAHIRALGEHDPRDVMAKETEGLDVRFFCGQPDVSELPSAYKDAHAVRAQISQFGLAEIVDEIEPYGSIMAGDWMHFIKRNT